jgi:hypothetical protein
MWLAKFGNPLSIRIRALGALGQLMSDEALHQLLDSASQGRKSVRAASLRGLAGHLKRLTLKDPRRIRVQELAHEASQSSDRRLKQAGSFLVQRLSEFNKNESPLAPPNLKTPNRGSNSTLYSP